MNTIRYSLKHVFARDMALKMNYGSSFDLVKLKKVTVEYTSKYLLEDPKHSFLAFVALKLVTNQTPKMTFAQKSVAAFKLKKGQVLGCTLHYEVTIWITFYNNVFLCISLELNN